MVDSKQISKSPVLTSLYNKQVVVEIKDAEGTSIHKLGPILLLECSPQKLASMKNTPEKRTAETGKLYTPPMFRLLFQDDASLVFVAEDTTVAAIYNGARFILDKTTVDVVLYEHE